MSIDDDLGLAPEPAEESEKNCASAWRILVVDDDPHVHAAARLALRDIEFQGRGLDIAAASSAAEAEVDLAAHPETALALVDVVMEREDAGLRLVRTIREKLNNHLLRIVIVTGHPGQAPQREVVRDYDINDYHEKTEMSASRFYAVVVNALRGFSALAALDSSRKGLAKVAEASGGLFAQESDASLMTALLREMVALLGLVEGGWLLEKSLVAVLEGHRESRWIVVAALGNVKISLPASAESVLSTPARELLTKAELGSHLQFDPEHGICVGLIPSRDSVRRFVYLEGLSRLGVGERQFIELLLTNTGRAHDQIVLRKKVNAMQTDTLHVLCDAIEMRSGETGFHARRVGEMAALFGELVGLSEEEQAMLKVSAPLHDVGKIAIPDAILNKPGSFNEEEWRIMKTHAQAGYDMLQSHNAPWVKLAAEISLTHHERWDGKGYPQGLAGEAIPLHGRFVKLADVFDALLSKRCYKAAWSYDRVLETIQAGAGTEFDPELTHLMLAHADRFLDIRRRLPD